MINTARNQFTGLKILIFSLEYLKILGLIILER